MSDDKEYIITQEQIDEIEVYRKNHSSLAIKNILMQLPIYKRKQSHIFKNTNDLLRAIKDGKIKSGETIILTEIKIDTSEKEVVNHG